MTVIYDNANVCTIADIIHTVGPQGEFADELKSCYQSCIQRMIENSLKSIVWHAVFSVFRCFL